MNDWSSIMNAVSVEIYHPAKRSILGLAQIALRVCVAILYCVYEYVVYRVNSRLRFHDWQVFRSLDAWSLKTLLRGLTSDLYTFLFRMETRANKFPFPYICKGLPVFEDDQGEDLTWCARTFAYMSDTKRLDALHPTATAFDAEIHLLGWEQGEAYGLCSQTVGTADSNVGAFTETTTA